MPRRDDLNKILVLGSGPIVIGQAAEFDYSGAQACKVLLEEGYEVVLVNSNPATIMTDPEFATATYVEPLLPGPVSQVIERERPDALLPTLGGQTALNLAKSLHEDGTLEQYGVELIGATYDAICRAEDRELFDATMRAAGLRTARNTIATSLDEARVALDSFGLPLIIRPAFTLGGRGGGIARSHEDFERIVAGGLAASPIGQVLIDESVLGWGEFELEVMRDGADNVVIVCSIENVDPMGVHTGDSVTVAPQQTLTDRQYQKLRDQAIAVIRAVGVETGGSNVQFAVNPATDEIVVIEMNPRVSRSSALASKATGFPIAKIAARLAVGYRLDEIDNDITKRTPASFEPVLDYAVVKWPRFAFEKFPGVDTGLSTHMKSVGEVMAIGRTFRQAFAKAMRSRELDSELDLSGDLLSRLESPSADRYDLILELLHRGVSEEEIRARTGIDLWFLRQLKELGGAFEGERTYRAVDTCAAEFEAETPYFYSAWEQPPVRPEIERGEKPSVMILGSGPNRIGQGIEFDYCCVHAAMTVRESGRDAVMVNCNPETVSTDYDTSDRLYFEPLTLEDVLAIVEVEQPEGVIVQFGGQTPLKLAAGLEAAGVPLLGTQPEAIDLAEDRGRFSRLLGELGLKVPPYATAASAAEALAAAPGIGWPVLVRPSYVLGGRAMEIVYDLDGLRDYLVRVGANGDEIFLDRFLENAIEVDVDAICDGEDVWIGGVMQHVEEAGIHSGDSRLRAASALARLRDAGGDPRGHAPDRAGARDRRPDQRPVRRAGRRPVRDRGQPARVAHGPVRLQGDRAAAGQARLPGDAGREAVVARPARRSRRRPRLGQGGGAPVRPLRRRRRPARPRDALDRRGDGRGRRLPGRVRQGAGRGRRAAAEVRHRLPHRHRHRQVGGDGDRRSAPRPRLPDRRHPRDRRLDLADGDPGRADQQDRRGLAARGRLDRRRRGRPRHQHPDRHRGPHRRLRDPPRRRRPRYPVHHHDRGRDGGQPRDRGGALGRAGRGLAAGAARERQPRVARGRAMSQNPALREGPGAAGVVNWVGIRPTNSPTRTLAPLGRRSTSVVERRDHGPYVVFTVADPEGPAPDPGQFYMLTAAERWGGGEDERPFLPRAFSVMRRREGELDFLLEDVGPGTNRLASSSPATSCSSSARSARASPARARGGVRSSSAAASASRRSPSGATRSARPRSPCWVSAMPPTPRAPR